MTGKGKKLIVLQEFALQTVVPARQVFEAKPQNQAVTFHLKYILPYKWFFS